MRWTPGGRSKNLEDMRGASSGGGGGGGFGGGGGGGRRLGLGGLVVLIVLSVIFKQDLITGSGGLSDALPASSGGRPAAPLQDSLEENAVQFMSSVLDSAQIGWSRTIDGYRDAKLVLFRDAIESACGFAESATGPFYCPGDQKVYILSLIHI